MKLDKKLDDIVTKHHIRIQNAEGFFGRGVDKIFQFLDAEMSILWGSRLGCLAKAARELGKQNDPRFWQNEELTPAGVDLADYLVSEAYTLNPSIATAMAANIRIGHSVAQLAMSLARDSSYNII